MTLSPTLKWTLAASLAAAAFAALQPEDESSALVDAAPSPSRARGAEVAARPPAASQADAEAPVAAGARDAWPPAPPAALIAWGAPPPPPPAPPAPPPSNDPPPPPAPPQAPSFPYTLIGRIDDELGPQLLLTGPMKTIAARPHDVIDGQWRVDAIQPGGATVTWLPGSLQQALSYRAS